MFIIIPFFILHIRELKQRRQRRQREWQHLCTSITLFCKLLYSGFTALLTLLLHETRTWRFLLIFTFYGRRRKTKTFLFLFLNLSPVQKHATLLDGTCYVRLHTLLRVVWGLLRKVWNRSNFWAKNSQHFFCSLIADAHACTCITLFGTFPFRHRTTMTWKCLISRFMENVNKGRRIFLSGSFST